MDANPTLIGKMHGDGDVYSQIFNEARVSKSRMHGFGLLVGVKNSVMLNAAMAALRESREENLQLRSMVT